MSGTTVVIGKHPKPATALRIPDPITNDVRNIEGVGFRNPEVIPGCPTNPSAFGKPNAEYRVPLWIENLPDDRFAL